MQDDLVNKRLSSSERLRYLLLAGFRTPTRIITLVPMAGIGHLHQVQLRTRVRRTDILHRVPS